MKQAAMYLRVSTVHQKEEATIESQKSVLLKFAKEQGYEIPDHLIFEDNGVSGATLNRPALDRMRNLACENLFNCLFILSPDRLSRKYAYQVILIEELKKHDVHVNFKSSPPSNSPGETLLEQMQGMFAEYERAQITERTRRGKAHKARNGIVNVLTKAPYGYRYICATATLSAYYEIVEKEAEVVKMIFNLYVHERLSVSKIRNYLSVNRIPSPKGNPEWGVSSITDLLKNSSYRGIAYFGVRSKAELDSTRLPNRQVRINGRKTPKRAIKRRPQSEWIPIPVPSIISEEVYELAQQVKGWNTQLSTRNTKKENLLQGLISCKECGYGFAVQGSGKSSEGYRYYRCNNKTKSICKNRGILIKQLDEAIWNSLIEVLNTPSLIQNEISRRFSELKNEPILLKKKEFSRQIAKLELESNRLLDAYQEGCMEMSDLKLRMGIIKRESNHLKQTLKKEGAGLSHEQLLELDTVVAYFSKRLKISKDELSFDEKRKILKMLIKEIQIGCADIVIKHILPVGQTESSNQIARLQPNHSDVETLMPPQTITSR